MERTQTAVTEDAWGDEAEDPSSFATATTGTVPPNLALRQRLLSSQQASTSTKAEQQHTGSYSLQAYCLGCLGQYIEELLLCGEQVLPFLPPDAKASLMAIARRQGLIDDHAINLLLDSSWTTLDVADSSLTDRALQAALKTTPHLLLLDLTESRVSQMTVRSLGTWCPQLQVLRIGCKNGMDDHAWAMSIKHIMPTVVQTSHATESWEALAMSTEQSNSANASAPKSAEQTASSVSYSRLTQLKYLVWPHIPIKTAELFARKFPKVIVNPTPRLYPGPADPTIALDEAYMRLVAPFWEQERLQEPTEPEYIVPLSERFRMAYVSRAERIAAKAERNYQQRKRRELRNNTVLQALARFKFL